MVINIPEQLLIIMAKGFVLYGVFLWVVLGFCGGAGGGVVIPRGLSVFPREQVESGREVLKTGRELDLDSNRVTLQSIFRGEIGVRELTGKNDGERVEAYLAVTGLGKGYAWCASYVSWCFGEAGFSEPRTAWSPALFPKARVIWERGKGYSLKPNTHDQKPAAGDVFGIYFASLKRIAHVGFVDEWGDKYVISTEGNTNEIGSNEGDGVYRKRRLISSIYQVSDWVSAHSR